MLTPAQLTTLKAAILAETNATFVAYRNGGVDSGMSEWYNEASTTDAWRIAVDAQTMDEASDYASFDTIVAGKRDSWGLFLQYAPRDFGRQKTRKVITDVWGNATAGSNAEEILQAGVEKATRGEMVFGGTAATTGTVTATKRNWVGRIETLDISKALRG
jgi:hypothetical protein